MSGVNRTELLELATHRDDPCVSLYMTANAPGADGPQNPIRWKNLIAQAAELLEARKMRRPDIEYLLQPASELIQQEEFWQASHGGVAAFLTNDFFRVVRISGEVEDAVHVTNRFVVRPLVPHLETVRNFLLLALSQKKVQLYRCTSDEIEPVEVPEMPKALEAALNYDEPEPSIQTHSAMHGSLGKQAAVFHGQGGAPDQGESELVRFLQLTNSALERELRDSHLPLLVAAVDSTFTEFRKINRYPHLLEENVHGNADRWSDSELHERAGQAFRNWTARQREHAIGQCQELIGTPRTCSDVDGALLAAGQGRVGTLVLSSDAEVWGKYDTQRGSIEIHQGEGPGEEDLLELAAVETLRHGGDVYAVPPDAVPAESPVVALYRY